MNRFGHIQFGDRNMLESRIYVGLLDKDTREQMHDISDYKLRLREICKAYKAPFSVTFMEGGYFHDDGSWVEENSLMVTLLNVPEDTVYAIASGICEEFHQESVIIVMDIVMNYNVRNRPGNKRSWRSFVRKIRSFFGKQ